MKLYIFLSLLLLIQFTYSTDYILKPVGKEGSSISVDKGLNGITAPPRTVSYFNGYETTIIVIGGYFNCINNCVINNLMDYDVKVTVIKPEPNPTIKYILFGILIFTGILFVILVLLIIICVPPFICFVILLICIVQCTS